MMQILKAGMKRQQLEETIRAEIISGALAPGSRLPTYEGLNHRFNASRATFQHVLNTLKQEGFLRGVERQGVFVADRLPHLTRFGLLFDSSEHDNMFLAKLRREAMRQNREGEVEFAVFHGDAPADGKPVAGPWRELRAQLAARRLAGLCFFFCPADPDILELLEEFPDIPKVLYDDYPGFDRLSVLRLDPVSCAERGLRCLQEAGTSRLAVIARGEQPLAQCVFERAVQFGLEARPEWLHAVPVHYTATAENLVRLLLSLPEENRPDALYITDDNLLNIVQSGIVKAGIRVPEQLAVVCHTNFPDAPEAVLPVSKVGYDVRELLARSVEVLREAARELRPVRRTFEGKYDSEIE